MRVNLNFIWIWLAFLCTSNSELRFCYKGPHRLFNTECAGGIFFKTPLDIKCFYVTTDTLKPSATTTDTYFTYSDNICTANASTNVVNLFTHLNDNRQMQVIRMNMTSVPAEILISADPNPSACIDACLNNVETTFLSNADPEEPEQDDGIPPVTNETILSQMELSESLFTYILESNEDEAKGTPDPRILQLFQTMQRVLLRYCGQTYLTAAFMERVYLALRFMAVKLNKFRIKDMGAQEFTVINEILHNCLNSSRKMFELHGPHCANKARITSIGIYSGNDLLDTLTYKLKSTAYRWGKYDIFTEAAWSVLDFTLNFCFDAFIPNLSHHHILQTHVESLFTEDVQTRWKYPQKLKKNEHYWNILASVVDIKWTMRNLDFCVQAASAVTPYEESLDRPFARPELAVKNDNIEVTTEEVTTESPTVVGWQGTVEEYWERYRAKGGFREIVQNFGFCARTEEEAENLERNLVSKCAKISA